MSLLSIKNKFQERLRLARDAKPAKDAMSRAQNLAPLAFLAQSQNEFQTESKNQPIFTSWEDLLRKAAESQIDLLFDDQRWLKKLGYYRVVPLFDQYIEQWIIGMNREKTSFRKQNAGRYKANSFIRLKLTRR